MASDWSQKIWAWLTNPAPSRLLTPLNMLIWLPRIMLSSEVNKVLNTAQHCFMFYVSIVIPRGNIKGQHKKIVPCKYCSAQFWENGWGTLSEWEPKIFACILHQRSLVSRRKIFEASLLFLNENENPRCQAKAKIPSTSHQNELAGLLVEMHHYHSTETVWLKIIRTLANWLSLPPWKFL